MYLGGLSVYTTKNKLYNPEAARNGVLEQGDMRREKGANHERYGKRDKDGQGKGARFYRRFFVIEKAKFQIKADGGGQEENKHVQPSGERAENARKGVKGYGHSKKRGGRSYEFNAPKAVLFFMKKGRLYGGE